MAYTILTNPTSNVTAGTVSIPASSSSGTYTLAGGSVLAAAASNGITGWSNVTSPTAVHINEDGISMASDADITIGGQSLKEFMEGVSRRLAILVPDPELLEEFEALKQAYEHYKTLEALCVNGRRKDD